MKILIIEDEPAAASRLKRMLSDLDPNVEVLGTISSVEEAIKWFSRKLEPDLVFMDIQLEDGNSFEILESIRVDCPIVFTTAYDQYAIRAFRYHSIDYLLKPYKETDLQRACKKYLAWGTTNKKPEIDYERLVRSLNRTHFKDRFLVQQGATYEAVRSEEIAYFFTKNKIVFAVLKQGKKYPLEHNLEQLEDLLDPGMFFRVNRQYIVGFDSITKMHAYSKSRLKLQVNPPAENEIIVSTDRSPGFRKWLSGVPGE